MAGSSLSGVAVLIGEPPGTRTAIVRVRARLAQALYDNVVGFWKSIASFILPMYAARQVTAAVAAGRGSEPAQPSPRSSRRCARPLTVGPVVTPGRAALGERGKGGRSGSLNAHRTMLRRSRRGAPVVRCS